MKDKNRIRKGNDGQWRGETLTTVKGQDFEISTYKNDRGVLVSRAMRVQVLASGGVSFSSDDIFNHQVNLIARPVARLTEGIITQQHSEAVALFDQKVEAGEIQAEEKLLPVVGTVLFSDDQTRTKGSRGNFHIVYQIKETQWGTEYLTVEPTTLRLDSYSHVKPYSEKFGIGMYFEPDYKFEGDDQTLADIVMDAVQLRDKKAEEEEIEQMKRDLLRSDQIAEGKEIVTVPPDAKTVIVAKFYENTSDYQTDYYATTVNREVYLAWSKHDKNNMSELIAAAKNFEGTRDIPEDHEHTKNTNYASYQLPTYFFGNDRWSGWKVTKLKYDDIRNEKVLEQIYIAAAQGRYFCNLKSDDAPVGEKIVTDTVGDIQIVDYSEKAIAVIGDTKPLKDQLKALGGRFNFRLKCGAGWIFAKTKTDEVKSLLNQN